MRGWLVEQITVARGAPSVVMLAADAEPTDEEIRAALPDAQVVRSDTWFTRRQAWERHRHGLDDNTTLVIIDLDPGTSSVADLPFDIATGALVIRLRHPLPPSIRPVATALDDATLDAAAALVASGAAAADALLLATAGIDSSAVAGEGGELRLALRLIGQPDSVIELAKSHVHDELARAVLDGDVTQLAARWRQLTEDGPAGHADLLACRNELTDLFLNGAVPPASTDTAHPDLPVWTRLGVRHPTPVERLRYLLDVGCPVTSPASFESWSTVAAWWGEVRAAVACANGADTDLETRAWAEWDSLDIRFHEWLRASYGAQLTRSWSRGPVSVDKVAHHLRLRRASGHPRQLLIVIDGLGPAHWAILRNSSTSTVLEGHHVMAMLPTLTEVSRQAIAAGALPLEFVDHLDSTRREARHWSDFWSPEKADWLRIDAADIKELDAIPLGADDALGVVLSAVDEIMHAAAVLGDAGAAAELRAWAERGVLDELVRRGHDAGYETWITADHGSLPCRKVREPREGDFVERNGTRVRRYSNQTLRNDSATDGVTWDDLPGCPPELAERLLFAPGRDGWGHAKLSHGGLSLDEVLVPYVRVGP